MAIAKAERLMNLALCLLGTRRPLSKRELRGSIEAYLEAGSDDSFNRMFERDKDDLRELGLVIETVENLDGDTGYLARRDSNRLPAITLDAEEAAALGLAAKVWQQARLAGAASGALQKLRAAGMPEAEDSYEAQHSALEPRIPVHEAAFEPLMLACRDRRPVVFDYRKGNAARPEQRQVEPWTLECWRGHWYLAGWDRDRAAERVFRLSRITGKVRSRAGSFTAPVPDVVTVRETVESWAGETATRTARDPAAHRLRLSAARQGRVGTGTGRRLGRVGDSVRARSGCLAGGVRPGCGRPGARGSAGRRGGAAARRGQGLRGTVTTMAANAIDQTRRMLSLVTYLRERPGAHVGDVARAFGITEDELISDLDVLPMCGTSFRGGDLLDIDTDGDRIWWHNPRRRRRAAAARGRRGDRAAGGRARRGHAARAARGRPRGPDPGHRQAGGGGGRGGRGELPAVRDLRVRGRGLRRGGPGDLGAPAAVAAVLLARARRAHRARGRPDPAVRRRATPTWRPGAGSPRRGRTFRLDRVAEIRLLDDPVRAAGDRTAGSVGGARAALRRRSRGGHRGGTRRTLGGGVLPARQRGESRGRWSAHHAAYTAPVLAAPAGAAARPGRADRRAPGPRGQRAAGGT